MPTSSGLDILVTDVADPEVRSIIAAGLRSHNNHHAGEPGNLPLAVLLRNSAGEVVGGLWGSTYFRWLHVELLHIPPHYRHCSLGSTLIHVAEVTARVRDCVGVWLDTFSFQAPDFYERLGYTRFGTLKDFPPGHDRFFMWKPL